MRVDVSGLQNAKAVVLDYQRDFNTVVKNTVSEARVSSDRLVQMLTPHTAKDFHWRGMHPFHQIQGIENVCSEFWTPFVNAFSPLQRRQDIFFAGNNDCPGSSGDTEESDEGVWVCSMGNFFGLFDRSWLGIPPTGKMIFIRYAEFYRVEAGRMTESALFLDILSVMKQAGHYPLPPETGTSFMYPGPATHDGVLVNAQSPSQGVETMSLINRMIADLTELNQSGNDQCPPELLQKTWHDDMLWYGPAGIGASYTIKRYQKQHQYPFREGLGDKVFNGHVCRIAEGCYGGFFGWPNLNNTARGGFLGLPSNDTFAEMRVVDVYRRHGDKLAENWIFIDMLHYLNMQGLDVLARLENLLPDESLSK